MVVDTLSGVPRVGGKVIGGNTACILVVMKASLTNDVSNELFPVALSPTMQIQTVRRALAQHQMEIISVVARRVKRVRRRGRGRGGMSAYLWP